MSSISINLSQLRLNLKNTKRPYSEGNETSHRIFTSNITDREIVHRIWKGFLQIGNKKTRSPIEKYGEKNLLQQ